MSQTVEMIIEFRGGEKHLHLQKKPGPKPHLRVDKGGDSQVIWRVTADASTGPIGSPLTAVTIWFPHVSPLFIQSLEIPIPVREVTIPISGGTGSATLTVNPSFDRGGLPATVDFVIPLAIYCTVDGGQANAPNGNFHQRGRQMIDGDGSHPECNVGP